MAPPCTCGPKRGFGRGPAKAAGGPAIDPIEGLDGRVGATGAATASQVCLTAPFVPNFRLCGPLLASAGLEIPQGSTTGRGRGFEQGVTLPRRVTGAPRYWIPACAGMTPHEAREAGTLGGFDGCSRDSRFRGNDGSWDAGLPLVVRIGS